MTPRKRLAITLWHLMTALGIKHVTEWLQLTETELREVVASTKILSQEDAQRVFDLAFIYDSLTLDYLPQVALAWLLGNNAHLGGTRPLDAVWYAKTTEVYSALMAQRETAFA